MLRCTAAPPSTVLDEAAEEASTYGPGLLSSTNYRAGHPSPPLPEWDSYHGQQGGSTNVIWGHPTIVAV